MNDISLPQREAPDSLMLYDFWYRALPGRQVRGSHLQKAMLLETPLAIGRDGQGRAFALHDACPHRGMPLSHGLFDGQQVECSYHGWKFDAHTRPVQPDSLAHRRSEAEGRSHLCRQLSLRRA